jgi:hypothetical protein
MGEVTGNRVAREAEKRGRGWRRHKCDGKDRRRKERDRDKRGRERDGEITSGGEKREPFGLVSPERGKRGAEV